MNENIQNPRFLTKNWKYITWKHYKKSALKSMRDCYFKTVAVVVLIKLTLSFMIKLPQGIWFSVNFMMTNQFWNAQSSQLPSNLSSPFFSYLGIRNADITPSPVNHVTLRHTLKLGIVIGKSYEAKAFGLTSSGVNFYLQLRKSKHLIHDPTNS